MQSLKEFADRWEPTERCCKEINESFKALTDSDPDLKALRDYVEQNAYGMGERSFYHMWKLIAQDLPDNARMLEIGVHRGQTLALWRILKPSKHTDIIGLSPFDGSEVGEKRDYKTDVQYLHMMLELQQPGLITGYSETQESIEMARDLAPLDVLYIDGGHSYETTRSDILNYSPLVRPGGFLVIDDCACSLPHPWGYFAGIMSVCKAVDKLLPPATDNAEWRHLGAVMHNRIWQKL